MCSVCWEIRKIATPYLPGKEKFMIFRKHGGNCYRNFLRRTFDKVQEVTRRVRIVRLLLPLLCCCSCWETLSRAELLCHEDTKRESRAKFHFHGGTRASQTRSKPHRAIGDERDIFFRHDAERWRYPPSRNFLHYVNLCAKWTSRTKQHAREDDSEFENTRVCL